MLDWLEQEAFEAEHPLPEAFLAGPRGMIATFITTGCDKARLSPAVKVIHLTVTHWACRCTVFIRRHKVLA